MKKNFFTVKNILMGVFATTAMATTSCSDDFEDFDSPKSGTSISFSSNDPLGIGYNSITADVNEISSTMIPVNTDRISISNSNANIEYKVISKDGKTFIHPVYHGNGGETDVVRISHMDSNVNKAMFVSINPASQNAIASRAVSAAEMYDNVLNTLAFGIIPGKPAPEVKAELPVFNVNAIMEYNRAAADMQDNIFSIRESRFSDYFYRHAKSHNEHVQQEAKSVGIDLAIPFGGVNFGFGMNYNKNENSKSMQERESATYGWVERAAVGSISQTCLLKMLDKDYADNNALEEYVDQTAKAIMAVDGNYNVEILKSDIRSALAFQKVMSASLNDALNNTNSSAYKMYNQANEGDITNLRNLITRYGMYVSTTCQMGGIAQTTLSRNANSSEVGIEWAIKMKASGAQNMTIKQTETREVKDSLGNVVKKVIDSNPSAAQFTLTVDKSSKVQDILQAMDEQTETKCWGGSSATEVKDWKFNADDPSQWVCISYASPRQDNLGFCAKESNEMKKTDSNLIPLWRLCIDPVRRAALRNLIEPDAKNQINYFSYDERGAKHLVIADVQLKLFKKDVKEKDVLPYYAQDHRKTGSKKHLYIPLRNNENGLAGAQSIVSLGRQDLLLRESNDFVGSYDPVLIDNTMVPFVAYEWVYDKDLGNDYTGITSINFGTASGEETVCSERTFTMIHGCPAMDPDGSQYLLLTYAKDNTPINERIKAVGFQYTKNVGKAKRGQVFASSLGTELNGNYDTSAEYTKHWGGNDFLNSNVKEGTHIFHGIWCSWYTLAIGKNTYQTKKTIYPCASTKDVTYDITQMIKDAVKSE